MQKRMGWIITTLLLVGFLLACSQAGDEQASTEEAVAPTDIFAGEFTLEERIAKYPTVVRASLNYVALEVVEGTGLWDDQYALAVKFNLTVQEYLNGSGGDTITAIWGAHKTYDSRAAAMAASTALIAQRDTSFDDREAIIFLKNDTYDMFSTTKGTDVYYLEASDNFDVDDGYSLRSRDTKLWLPSATDGSTSEATEGDSGGSSSGDSKEFLLALPEDPGSPQTSLSTGNATSTPPILPQRAAASNTPTITVGALKTKIATINAEIALGNNAAGYRKCIGVKYEYQRRVDWAKTQGLDWEYRAITKERVEGTTIPSGAPAGTAHYVEEMVGNYPDDKTRTWLEGRDSALFEVIYGPNRPWDYDNDGTLTAVVDAIWYDQTLQTVRPLPAGEYNFDLKDLSFVSKVCNYVITTPWTVTVIGGDVRTKHEALFDPVTDGTAVAADSSNGQLEPATFTDANNASATIQRIEWAAASTGSGQTGTVKVKVSPHTGLAGHKLEFFELDGSVSLSLRVDEATVDATNRTLSWSVSEQPWHDGDELMLRIAEFVTDVDLLNVPATITQGQRVSVTVRATDLPSSNSYAVRLTRSNVSFGFDNDCLDGNATVTVPSGSASHSATIALLGCNVISGTLTATLMQGASAVATATAEVEVEASSNVTVTLSPREEQHGTYTDMAVEWTDPSGCAGRYFVGIFNGTETVVSSLGYHPAPATTSLTKSLGRLWDDIANLNWFVKVRCHASAPSRMTIVGQASLQSGLPSTP